MYSSFCSLTFGVKPPLVTVDGYLQRCTGVARSCDSHPLCAHLSPEVVPGASPAVFMVAVKPEPAAGPLTDACARPVAARVFVHPRADDGEFPTNAVGELPDNLDAGEEFLELQLGAVVGLRRRPRRRGGALWHGLLEDLGIPATGAG